MIIIYYGAVNEVRKHVPDDRELTVPIPSKVNILTHHKHTKDDYCVIILS